MNEVYVVPWEFIGSAAVPDCDRELRLYRRGTEYSIRVAGCELMNSRMHGSEDALARLACDRVAGISAPRILIGGLGMGFTLAASLGVLGSDARVTVAELVPEVVRWNRDHLAALAGNPLGDVRVTVCETDVFLIISGARRVWDAILLDVDNGPDGLTSSDNDRLYSRSGLAAAYAALRPAGVLAVWSASADPMFNRRLRQAGFAVDEVKVRTHGTRGGRQTIWLARRNA
jgi:spermidine synthase